MARAARSLPGLEAIPDHSFETRDPQLEMFAPPPAEIGQVITGASTLREGVNEKPMWLRAGLVGLILGLAVLVGWNSSSLWIIILVAAGVAWWVWHATRFDHHVTYVGTDGLARIGLQGERTAARKTELLRFQDAAGLLTATTHHSTNGVYQHTTFQYRWTDRTGRVVFSIGGQYHRDKLTNNAGVQFARSAEIAWSQRELQFCLHQLEREGSIGFPLANGRLVRVGHGFMEFVGFQPEPVRVTKAEIETVTLGGGEFRFKHVDARWYSGKGKFNFSYANMSNARLFLLVLEKLMGYRWT